MKIALCVPSHSDPNHRFVQSYGPLLLHPTAHELKPFLQRRSPVSFNRNIIARVALDWGADALFWLDDDQTFPPDTLERLAAHDKPIVGCNIAIRSDPTGPTAAKLNDRGELEKVWTTAELVVSKAVEEVAHVGMGVCLIRREVFERVPEPWFVEAVAKTGQLVGEDCFFMEKARAAGFKVHLDHALSWEIGHVYEKVLWNTDTLTDRERWQAQDA